jgi:hypothetical protein
MVKSAINFVFGPNRSASAIKFCGGVPVLYKMYIIYQPAPGVKFEEQDPCQDFLPELLPELEGALSCFLIC